MIGWRITRKRHADLSGAGGLYASGRWHSQGRPILYMADHPALAMLEVLVHLDLPVDLLPDDYVLMRIAWSGKSPVQALVSEIKPDNQEGWTHQWPNQIPEEDTRRLGDEWLQKASAAVTAVPSVLIPHCRNFLFNPSHPEHRMLAILSVEPIPFDQRLFGQP